MPEAALELTRKAAAVFRERGFDNPRLEAELLLAGVIGVKRLDLYLQHDRPVDAAELERFRGAVRRRLKREPLQYILGVAAFRHLELHVDPRVLIPRPETEVLVGAVLDWARQHHRTGPVLDVGTGSGAIALSLAQEGGFARVVSVDVSLDALDVARANAQRSGLTGRVELRHGSLFEPVAADERYDVIVSNPPYVSEAERSSLMPEVGLHEPPLALFAGADGLAVLGPLIGQASGHLLPGGLLALEVGLGQHERVLALIRRTAAYTAERVVNDLAGRPRIVLAELAAEPGVEST